MSEQKRQKAISEELTSEELEQISGGFDPIDSILGPIIYAPPPPEEPAPQPKPPGA